MTILVYFIQAGESGPIKIGVTTSGLKHRLAGIQTGCPWKIRVLGAIPCSPGHERWLHHRFGRFRMHGEWFQPEAEILGAISEVLKPDFVWPEAEIEAWREEARRIDLEKAEAYTQAQVARLKNQASAMLRVPDLSSICRDRGISYPMVYHRLLRGWSLDRALTAEPIYCGHAGARRLRDVPSVKRKTQAMRK